MSQPWFYIVVGLSLVAATSGNRHSAQAKDPAIADPTSTPTVIEMTPPRYPLELLAKGISGTVTLEVAVDRQGKPTEVRVHRSSTHQAFDDAAVKAARTWKFKPAVGPDNLLPVPSTILCPVRFQIEGGKSATADEVANPRNPRLEWRKLPMLNDPQGFAGQFVGVAGNQLLLYGGSNFPDTPVWAGGAKRWYRDAFVLDAPDGAWRKIGSLDESRPVGYGVSLPTADGKILCIGGADAVRHYDSVFTLGLAGDKLTTTDLPKLPRPCAYMAGAILGGKVYVAGGIDRPDATRGLRTFWSLDLAKPETGWQELPTWPGRGRMLATVAADGEFVYLTGGCDLTSDVDGKPLRLYLRDTFRYSPKSGWQKLADAPAGIVAAPTPALTVGGQMIVFGGDDSTYLGFRPPEKHPGFPNNVYAYDVKADRWSRIGKSPFVPVASPLVKWLDGHVVASGEIRPGVRTREVWLVKPME